MVDLNNLPIIVGLIVCTEEEVELAILNMPFTPIGGS